MADQPDADWPLMAGLGDGAGDLGLHLGDPGGLVVEVVDQRTDGQSGGVLAHGGADHHRPLLIGPGIAGAARRVGRADQYNGPPAKLQRPAQDGVMAKMEGFEPPDIGDEVVARHEAPSALMCCPVSPDEGRLDPSR